MPNPVKAVADWLRGNDLRQSPGLAVEQKLLYLEGYNSALLGGMLVHGPGATELLGGRYGQDGNSAVFACLMAISMAFFEAPLRVYRTDSQGKKEAVAEHPLKLLLDSPNPHMDAREVLFWTAWALNSDGNAYLRKIRAGNPDRGNVVQLWPVSPCRVEPKTVKGSGDFISFYRVALGMGRYEDIAPEQFVHLKLGIDDRDQRLGIAPIKRLVRHVAGDDEASDFATALLKNFAVPGLVVETPDTNMTQEKAAEIKQRVGSVYGGSRRGEVGVLSNGAKMEQFGFSPEQMNLKALHQIPEARIAAVMRVPPAVAGLSVGLEQTSNYASFREVREMFTEGTLVPEWALVASKFQQQLLLPDFSSDRALSVEFDLTDVRALQGDENEKYTRLDNAVKTGWITPDEARADVGLPALADGSGAVPMAPKPAPIPLQLPPANLPVAASRDVPEAKAAEDDIVERLQAVLEGRTPALARQLEVFQAGQHDRIEAALLNGNGRH